MRRAAMGEKIQETLERRARQAPSLNADVL